MSFFKKLGRGLKKLAKSKLVRGAVGTAIGGPVGGILAGKIGDKVLSTAKTIGRAARGRVAKPLDAVKLLPTIEAVRSSAARKIRRQDILKDLKTPVGMHARLPKRVSPFASSQPSGKRARRKASKSSAAPRASGKGRRPPPGGKDFKALSASWRAAGKPGTWLEWVKSH